MATDAGKFFVDTAGLNSGAASSRQASDHAGDGAANLAGASVGGDMFGGFPAASSFAEAVGASHADHVKMFAGPSGKPGQPRGERGHDRDEIH
jgi:hypothetical protein